MNESPEKIFEDVARMTVAPESIDPYSTPEYAAFVESMVPLCHCANNRPCDGVLAGGLCDNIQDDKDEMPGFYEDEDRP